MINHVQLFQFLSTPSARRATYHEWYGRIKDAISIHALREEGDGRHPRLYRSTAISIHALREEGDKRRGSSPGVF